ncbi:acyltransferase [Microbacterium sp. PRF11]|uniref:acyltransferase n=1 Tax=Microbacterium sp. PRF11 TaxID=2962593 RepID=UPI00288175B6|nr:acyltransferase [Microbacterium sp. PRF11]MDT0117738.1 acyltransferase [Microbacterium sp. PRF11]
MQTRRAVNRLWSFCVNTLGGSSLLHGHVRERFLRLGGIQTNGTSVRTGVFFASDQITFGKGGLVERGVQFENRESITVGSNVYIGPDCYIGTSSHTIGAAHHRAGTYQGASVSIHDGCWLGARVMVLPGVVVARGCVIAAGSVVTRDTTENGLYAGIPAIRKRDLT